MKFKELLEMKDWEPDYYIETYTRSITGVIDFIRSMSDESYSAKYLLGKSIELMKEINPTSNKTLLTLLDKHKSAMDVIDKNILFMIKNHDSMIKEIKKIK